MQGSRTGARAGAALCHSKGRRGASGGHTGPQAAPSKCLKALSTGVNQERLENPLVLEASIGVALLRLGCHQNHQVSSTVALLIHCQLREIKTGGQARRFDTFLSQLGTAMIDWTTVVFTRLGPGQQVHSLGMRGTHPHLVGSSG